MHAFLQRTGIPHSLLEERDCASETGRRALDLIRETTHQKTIRWEQVQVCEFFQLAITDLASRLVPFPDDRRIVCFCESFACEGKRRVPTPGIGPQYPRAAVQ